MKKYVFFTSKYYLIRTRIYKSSANLLHINVIDYYTHPILFVFNQSISVIFRFPFTIFYCIMNYTPSSFVMTGQPFLLKPMLQSAYIIHSYKFVFYRKCVQTTICKVYLWAMYRVQLSIRKNRDSLITAAKAVYLASLRSVFTCYIRDYLAVPNMEKSKQLHQIWKYVNTNIYHCLLSAVHSK